MDPSIRSQERLRTQQNSTREFQVKVHDIPDSSSSENTPPLPAGSENFTVHNTVEYTFLAAVVVCISYIAYKRYIYKK
jgi:hypothetical protein